MAFGRFAAAHYGILTAIDRQTEPGLEEFFARQQARCAAEARRSYRRYVTKCVALYKDPWPVVDLTVIERGQTHGGGSETEDS